MRIAVDASRTTLARRTGTENYAYQLLKALIQLDSGHQFTFYFRDAPPTGLFPDSPHLHQRVIPMRRAWTHLRFAAALFQDRPAVTFVPAHTLPLIFPGQAVVTVHDLGYLYFPEAHPLRERLYLQLTTRYSAHRASLILADSEATRRDLMTHYRVKGDKIRVVYPGVEGVDRATSDQITQVRLHYGLPERYFLFLGTLQPRKNIKRIAEAFAQFGQSGGDSEVAMVFGGNPGWLLDMARDVLPTLPPEFQKRIITPGYIPDEDVAALYSGALALVFPSLYEGFGFPVIEAMHCGTPVICANTSSLPELAGEAAIQVNPLEVSEVAAAMTRLATDPALAQALSAKGKLQAARFTWANAARQTLSAFEACI